MPGQVQTAEECTGEQATNATSAEVHGICSLTFKLSGRQRQGARPGLAKMYRVSPDGPGGLPLALRLSEGLGVTVRAED